jgi:hypothetical protein
MKLLLRVGASILCGLVVAALFAFPFWMGGWNLDRNAEGSAVGMVMLIGFLAGAGICASCPGWDEPAKGG